VYAGPKPHAVTQAGSNNYTYDLNGNMETGAGRTIVNNYDNKPSSITIGGATTSFVYNYQGQRVKKIVGGTPTVYIGKLYECTSGTCTKYVFGGITRIDLKPPAEFRDPQVSLRSIGVVADASESAVESLYLESVYAKQVIERSNPVALKKSSDVHYYHGDHLGGSNVITGVGSTKEKELFYYPYGVTWITIGSLDLKYKFTGQEEDQETGLYYFGARYYDPVIGRFISADSIIQDFSDPQAFNRYSYARNNPLFYVDPDGAAFSAYHSVFEFFASVSAGYGIMESLQNARASWDLDRGEYGQIASAHALPETTPGGRPQSMAEMEAASRQYTKGDPVKERHFSVDKSWHIGLFPYKGWDTLPNIAASTVHVALTDITPVGLAANLAAAGLKAIASLFESLIEAISGGQTASTATVPSNPGELEQGNTYDESDEDSSGDWY
jgi:RHS repeat-associated protein